MTAAPAASGVLAPGTDLAVTVTLDNDTDEAKSAGGVALAIGEQPLRTRAALEAWLSGDTADTAVGGVGAAPLDAAAAGQKVSATVHVPASDPNLADLRPGVYPIEVTASLGGATHTATSAFVVPGGERSLAVATIVPITAPAQSRGLLTPDALIELTAADGSLSAQLDAVDGTDAILAIDPAIPAAIRVLGDEAPAGAVAWLQRLLALPNSRFALQFADADLSIQAQAGASVPLTPISLDPYLRNDDASPSPAATADGEGKQPAAETDLERLTSIGDARANVYWPPSGTAGPNVVSALGALGGPEAPAITLVPSETTSTPERGARLDAPASSLLAYDSGISDLLNRASGETQPAKRASLLSSVTALLSLADTSAPLLVTVDRGSDRPRGALTAAIAAVKNTPGVTPLSLDQLVSAPAEPATVAEAAPDQTRLADVSALLGDEGSVARFATILDDPLVLTARERAEVLQLLGSAWREDADAAHRAVLDHRAATASTLDSVGILASGVNLVSYESALAPVIRNDLPWPVNLTLTSQPDDPRLLVEPRVDVRAEPQSNTRPRVPVQAEVANGQVVVVMRLMSPTGEPVGAPQNVGVDVHAEWETIGIVVLSVLFVGFIVIGVVRMVLRRRRSRAPSEPADQESTS